jgi:uncharacterized membrane protein
MQKQGKLILKKEPILTLSSLKSYITTQHSFLYWGIITLALATALAVFTINENQIPIVYLRYLLGSIFVLFLPGYSLIKALFPEKELDTIERIALSIGMSLVLVSVTSLVLNYTPWGIKTVPIIFSLFILTISFATIAIIRQHKNKISNE